MRELFFRFAEFIETTMLAWDNMHRKRLQKQAMEGKR